MRRGAGTTHELERVEVLAGELAERGVRGEVALVAGSGLGALADALEEARTVPFEALAGMPRSSVRGHAGRFVVGRWRGREVVVQQGRIHLYEGWRAADVALPMRALARVGVRTVVLTNAAGGLHADWPAGSWMRITDHLGLQGAATLLAGERAREGGVYDEPLGQALDRAADALGVELRRGVYAAMPGPAYETPAEIRALATSGVSAVGMSTAAEACAAFAVGLRVAALSCITNPAAGLATEQLSHADVVAAAERAAGELRCVLERALPDLV